MPEHRKSKDWLACAPAHTSQLVFPFPVCMKSSWPARMRTGNRKTSWLVFRFLGSGAHVRISVLAQCQKGSPSLTYPNKIKLEAKTCLNKRPEITNIIIKGHSLSRLNDKKKLKSPLQRGGGCYKTGVLYQWYTSSCRLTTAIGAIFLIISWGAHMTDPILQDFHGCC